MNSECVRIADQLRRAFNGDAWHGPSMRELLTSVTPEQASSRPLPSAHSIWELVVHVEMDVSAAFEAAGGKPLPRWDETESDWPPIEEINARAWVEATEKLFAKSNGSPTLSRSSPISDWRTPFPDVSTTSIIFSTESCSIASITAARSLSSKRLPCKNRKMKEPEDPRAAFIDACVWHGPLERAEAILTAHPEIAASDIYTAALIGDDNAVRRFLALDPGNATTKGGPCEWDALTYLCFSKYLRLDRARTDGFVRAATALLDAGASANTGFWEANHQPDPEWESALYGAAGVAHHAELTRLLIERGADPNDEETPYHTPESFDNAALKILVESGRLTEESLATMLLRKADWHDTDGIEFLLKHGADPNRMTRWHHTALHQALRRDNTLRNIELLLDYGAEPLLANRKDGRTAVAMAARRGRRDVLALFDGRGIITELRGVEKLIAACARGDGAQVSVIAQHEPHLVDELLAQGGTLLAEFAGDCKH